MATKTEEDLALNLLTLFDKSVSGSLDSRKVTASVAVAKAYLTSRKQKLDAIRLAYMMSGKGKAMGAKLLPFIAGKS